MDFFSFSWGFLVGGIFVLSSGYLLNKLFRILERSREIEKEIYYRRILNMYGWKDHAYVSPSIFSEEPEIAEAFRWMQEHGRIISDENGLVIGRFDTIGNKQTLGYSQPFGDNEKKKFTTPDEIPVGKKAFKVIKNEDWKK